MIVTFGCSSNVYVYSEKCGRKPMRPYQVHSSINEAIGFLIISGKYNIQVIEK